MKFRAGNKHKCFQDFGVFIGVPSGIDFAIRKSTSKENEFWLHADGYGNPGDYGNGEILVYGVRGSLLSKLKALAGRKSKKSAPFRARYP